MNIWIVNHYADPPDSLSTRSYDLGRRFVERGHAVTIFVSAFSHYHFRNLRALPWYKLWMTEDIDGVQFVWVRTTPYRTNGVRRMVNMCSFGLFATIAGAVRRPRPHVVSGVTVHPLAALSGWMLAKLHGARYFIEVTDLWPQSLIDLGALSAASPVAKTMRWLERFLYQRAERIVMLWKHTDSYVAALGVDTAKILWLPHGIEMHRYADLPSYDGAPRRPFRVMYLGGFAYSMALEVQLGAAKQLQDRNRSDIRLLLVGAGTGREQIIAEARAMKLDNVDFPPSVPKSEIGRAMKDADAFIFGVRDLPLYRYGMSLNKLTDYLIGGRPIIYYGTSTYDPVKEARAGFTVPPDDPVAVADAIERLADLSPDERREMGERGRQWALEYHHIPRLADTMLEVMTPEGDRTRDAARSGTQRR